MSKAAKFTKEDELLLKDFSAAVSKTGILLFYGISTLVGIAPLCLYYAIHHMDGYESWIIWAVSVAGVSYLLTQAYKNTKHILKHQIIVKRGDAIAREMNRLLGDDKKISRKERDERILWKKNEVGDYEAMMFSIFYNNVLFYAAFLFLGFFLFAALSAPLNCVLSMFGAAGVSLLFSTAK